MPDDAVPDNVEPDAVAPDNVVPGNVMPDNAVLGDVMLGDVMPDNVVPAMAKDVKTSETDAAEAEEAIDLVVVEPEPPQVFQPLSFIDVTLDLPGQYPVVVLQEFDSPYRTISIPVGMAEGNAIAFAAKHVATVRPLTHELMISIFEEFGLEVLTLRITGFEAGLYAGELVLSGASGQKTISCRVSDGIALCLRQRPPVPITALPSVIDQVGSPA
jgi:hypothetical protein